jgi:hypothetical protein
VVDDLVDDLVDDFDYVRTKHTFLRGISLSKVRNLLVFVSNLAIIDT